jgi:hypothetical protein
MQSLGIELYIYGPIILKIKLLLFWIGNILGFLMFTLNRSNFVLTILKFLFLSLSMPKLFDF